MNKIYTLKDLPRLKKENNQLVRTVKEMIELGVENGDYNKNVLENTNFIDQYLLEELNFGCIIIK